MEFACLVLRSNRRQIFFLFRNKMIENQNWIKLFSVNFRDTITFKWKTIYKKLHYIKASLKLMNCLKFNVKTPGTKSIHSSEYSIKDIHSSHSFMICNQKFSSIHRKKNIATILTLIKMRSSFYHNNIFFFFIQRLSQRQIENLQRKKKLVM